MAILQRVALLPNQRFDTPDARAIEAYSLNDWRYFLSGFMSDQSYVLSGFEVSNYATVFLVAGVKIKVSEVALFHSEATTQASGFYVSSGSESDISVSLSPSSTNFIECDLTTLSGTPDVRAFWDQAANGGAGAEFTDTIDTVNNLEISITSNISGFTPGKLPLYKAVTDSSGVVTSLTDARNLFFRLGTGGNSPAPLADYNWPAIPDASHARLENAVTTSSATATNQPFQGGDKNLKTFKDWMDAVMTSIKEIKGTPFWYQAAAGGSGAGSVPGAYQNSALTVLVGGTWEHDPASLGHLVLTGGSLIYRLGYTNNCSMSAFLDVDLTTHRVFYAILPSTDTAVAYGFGDDGLTPIVPKTISALTATSITVGLGGNYASGGGVIMAAGQEYTYTAYTPGTGVFSGVSPDPTLILAPGVDVYQLNSGATGYYHHSVSSKVPGRVGATSEGAERVIWLAVYDGSSVIQLKNGDLELGEQINVGDNTSLNVLDYMGSPSEAATQPSYSTTATGTKTGTTSYNSTAGENLTVRASKLTSMVADKAQDKTIKIVQKNLAHITNTTNGTDQEITFDATGLSAEFLGTVPGMATAVWIVAANIGISGNAIFLTFDGIIDIDTAVTNWNTANPSDTISVYGGDVTQIPNGGETIYFAGGVDTQTPELTVFVPGSANNGTITLTGTLTLAANESAYFTIDRNAVFSFANLAALTVVATASVPVGENVFIFAQRGADESVYLWDGTKLSAGVWPVQTLTQTVWDRLGITSSNTFSQFSSFNYVNAFDSIPNAIGALDARAKTQKNIVDQNSTLRLISGGNWSYVNSTGTLTWSADAFVSIPGISDNLNRILAGNVVLADGEVAYLFVQRSGTPPLIITPNIIASSSLVLTDDIIVFARRVGSVVHVGFKDGMVLRDGESKELFAGLSIENRTFIGISNEASVSPNWGTSLSAPLRTIPLNTSPITNAVASIDIELNKFFGQLRLTSHPSNVSRAKITGVDKTLLDNAILSQEITSLLMDFDGAEIDFQTGSIYSSDGITALGVNFTPFTIPASEYFWYGVAIIPNAVTALNKITAQVLVTPAASANATLGLAPLPPIAGTKKVGAVLIQNIAGTATLTTIRQLGVGSGSGSGTGDANELLERLKEGWADTVYDYLTPNVFSINETDLIDTTTPGASTGSYEVVTSTYVMDVAEKLTSLQMLDEDFLVSGRDLTQLDLYAYYTLANIDTAGTFEVSRDGGSNWQTVTVERISPESDALQGSHVFSVEPSNNTLKTWPVADATTTVAITGSGADQRLGQKVTLSAASVAKKVTLYLNKTGSPSGSLYAQIVKDSSGVPSTSAVDVLSQSAAVDITALAAGNIAVDFTFDATVLPAGVYHVVVFGDANYDATYSAGVTQIAVRVDASAPVDEPSSSFDGTIWTANAAQTLTYVLLGRALDLRVRITSGTAGSKLAGYGVLYAPGGSIVTEKLEQEEISFSGDSNLYSFTLSQFLPNPKNLKVYWKGTGKVFVWDDFAVDGQVVTFPVNTFNIPGETVVLLFDQSQGAMIDTSDANSTAIALATTRLGHLGTHLEPLKQIQVPMIDPPYSTVIGRAKIPDLANDLCVRYGIERIMIQQITEVQNEFGPNGQRVYKAVNDDRDLIRLVGSADANNNQPAVIRLQNTGTDYAEITFFGTGLNILLTQPGAVQSAVYSVDGGAESANFVPVMSSVIAGRNYPQNSIVSVVSGLSLGIHTVKIRVLSGSVAFFHFNGFEIIGPSASLSVQPGVSYSSANRTSLATQQLPSYNSGFTNVYGTAGTRGGRVLVYLASDGTIKKDIQYVDTAPAYLSSASHTNEEVIRSHSFREFGAARSAGDDFSLPYGANFNLAFTLDDGTTTLVGSNIDITKSGAGPDTTTESLWPDSTDFFTLTFVGTGLDIACLTDSATRTSNVFVDGTLVGTVSKTALTAPEIKKIASGLPYGTHTIKIQSSGVAGLGAYRFIVYGPKKPALPSGATELADYNLMANYVASTGDATSAPSTGSLFKSPAREAVYVNTWTMPGIAPSFASGMAVVSSAAIGNYVEYTFFGTGIESYLACTVSSTSTVQIDGVAYTGAAIVTNGGSWNSGTSTVTVPVAAGAGCLFQITGLSLGVHKIRITTSNAQQLYVYGFAVVTPVHSPKSNLYGVLQNSLPIGSQAISDNRKTQLLPAETTNKAWARAKSWTANPTTTSTVPVPLPDMSVTIRTTGRPVQVSFNGGANISNSGNATVWHLYIDGEQVTGLPAGYVASTVINQVCNFTSVFPLSAGFHKIDIYWSSNGAVTSTSLASRFLTVVEI